VSPASGHGSGGWWLFFSAREIAAILQPPNCSHFTTTGGSDPLNHETTGACAAIQQAIERGLARARACGGTGSVLFVLFVLLCAGRLAIAQSDSEEKLDLFKAF
jgi:hypothetical protein